MNEISEKTTPNQDPWVRHQRCWRLFHPVVRALVGRRFDVEHEDLDVDGPVLLVSNHVTNWDPLLVGMSLRKKQIYYVATEHLFRLGFVSKLLIRFFGPIPRPKGGSALETVRKCVEHLKAGHSVCLFAEGEASWDGQTHPIYPATGKLVKMTGVSLVTFRLEGAYFCLPRWRRTISRGKVYGHPVRIYSPEELDKMTAREINAAIDSDIYENAWERQKERKTVYGGKNRAEGLERGLYLCPECGKVGTLKTEGDRLFCSCGLEARYSESGFESVSDAHPVPFRTFIEWDEWQQEELKKLAAAAPEGVPLFSDEGLRFSKVGSGHEQTDLGSGTLTLYPDRLVLGELSFPLSELGTLAMVQSNRLLFSVKSDYYEAVTDKESRANLRKYLTVCNR